MNKWKLLWKDRQNQFKYAKWLYRYSRPYLGRILFMISVTLVSTVLSLVMVGFSKNIIDRASNGNEFKSLVLGYLVLMLALELLGVGSTLLSTVLNEKFSFGIRKQVYEKIIHSHWMDVKKYHTGDLMTRLTSDAGNIAEGIISTIPNIITLFLELVMVFFTLFYYSRLLACFALLVAPVAGVVSVWFGRKLKFLQIKVQESEASYRSFLQESLANLLVVKAFANEEYSAKRLTRLRSERFDWVYKKAKFGMIGSVTISLTFQIGYLAALAYGAFLISTKTITYGTMSVFLTLVNRVQSPVLGLIHQIPKVVSVLASAGRVMELQNIPLEEKKEITMSTKEIGVRISHLTFGYSEEAVLEDVSLHIHPGEFVAIIGESGIGKTTLIRLIMSFMSNLQGSIEFYNNEGETMDANAGMRNFIAYVPQGNTLFSGTVRENIRMGKLEATEEEIWDALKMAAAMEFVQGLPKGLDTIIGERGHGISEGQAQRIAIARALLRRSPLLILDEATSSLDEATELKVLEELQGLKPRPTCLIITHRKSILQYCDREIRIDHTKLSEL